MHARRADRSRAFVKSIHEVTPPPASADTVDMTRIGHLLVLLCAVLAAPPAVHADDCRERTTGDICAAGSPWSDFTRFRVETPEDQPGTTTMTMFGSEDFSESVRCRLRNRRTDHDAKSKERAFLLDLAD
jgi:hypothetical protein